MPCSLDYLNQYGKNIRTADLESAQYDPGTNLLEVEWRGFSDIPTKFPVFTEAEGEIKDRWAELPVYRDPVKVSLNLRQDF